MCHINDSGWPVKRPAILLRSKSAEAGRCVSYGRLGLSKALMTPTVVMTPAVPRAK